MTNLEQVLYDRVRNVMLTWDEEDIYAVSFFIYSNEMFRFRDYDNVSTFAVSYNTEADCEGAGIHSEERWNYAFWRQNEHPIIEADDNCPEMQLLFDWYREQGIENIGEETGDWENGPVGYKELVKLAAKVARRFQDEGFLMQKFGKPIPIIIHDLEYCECTLKATEFANPKGEAADFLYGNWESAPAEKGVLPADPKAAAKKFAEELASDPQKLEQFYGRSPGISREMIEEMLKRILNS